MEKLIGTAVKLCNSEPNTPLSETQNAILHKHFTHIFSKLRVTPDHPPYAWMIEKALQELDEEGGSSAESISDFIKKEHKSLPGAHTTMLKHHLQIMTDKGELLMIDGRFLLPGDSESVNPKSKNKSKCVKRNKRGNLEIKQKSGQMEKEENKQVQHDDVEVVRERKDLDEQQNDVTVDGNCGQESVVNEEYWELNKHHNEPSTDKDDGKLSDQQNDVTGNKVFHRRVLRSTVHKQKGKEQLDATEGSVQSSVALGSGIGCHAGSMPIEPPGFMMAEETEHLQDLELQQSKLSIITVEETADISNLCLQESLESEHPGKEEAVAEDLSKTKKQQKKLHGWQQTNWPITRAQAKGTVTPKEQPISGRTRAQVKLAMESSSERAQRQLKRWSKNAGEPKSVSTSKVKPLALCDSADQQLVLVEEPLSISIPLYASANQHLEQMEEPLALVTREEAMNLTDPQHEVHLRQPKDKRREKTLKGKDDGTDPDTALLKDVGSTKKLAKKKNDRGGGRRKNAR